MSCTAMKPVRNTGLVNALYLRVTTEDLSKLTTTINIVWLHIKTTRYVQKHNNKVTG